MLPFARLLTSRRPPTHGHAAPSRSRAGTLSVGVLWAALLGWEAHAAPPSVTLLTNPTPFVVTSANVQAGGQLSVVEGGSFDMLFDPGRCSAAGYTVAVSRNTLNWPAGLALQVRVENVAAAGACALPLPPLGGWATYVTLPAGAGLTVRLAGGPLRATLRYRLDFQGLSNPLALPPGLYTTTVTYTITAP